MTLLELLKESMETIVGYVPAPVHLPVLSQLIH